MFFVGDLHGNFNKLKTKICYYNNTNYIQLGDFGVGFKKNDYEILTELNNVLVEYNSNLFILRGNHDNPEFWNGLYEFSNINFVKDNSILNIDGYSILFLGGGISIDRVNRINDVSYWKNETIDYSILLDKEFDIICTHVPYRNIYGWDSDSSMLSFYAMLDKQLKLDLEEEERFMKYVNEYVKTIKCKYWFSGHFHESVYLEKDRIKYKSLGIDEFLELL
jgi:UDP-2,3-diacylglucosamine pyrophosphatase LpxH